MFERQFGLRENPFAAGHQSKYVYPSREHQEALAHLRFGIENREPFVLITGEVGTGKTTALYDALSEWKSRAVVALITNSALTRSELYEEICLRFGVPLAPPISKPMLMGHLERHLLAVRARGDFAVLLIDEAQNLNRELLEEVRLLSNLEAQGDKLMQIFLVGQPELEEKLDQSQLRQLRQRIAVSYRLRPLSAEDTERYIHHRITVAGGHALTIFPADSCLEIFAITHGIPREINTLAAQALLNAFVEDAPSVRPEHVRTAQRDTGFRSVLDREAAAAAAVSPAPVPAEAAARSAATMSPPVSTPGDPGAVTREVRHVPEAAPAASPPEPRHSGRVERPEAKAPDATVRPAGNAETWQSWMESLTKVPQSAPAKSETSDEAYGEEAPAMAVDPSVASPAEEASRPPDHEAPSTPAEELSEPPEPEPEPLAMPAQELSAALEPEALTPLTLEPVGADIGEPDEPMPLVEEFAPVPVDAEPPSAPEFEEVLESPMSEALPAARPSIEEPVGAFERITAARVPTRPAPAAPPAPPTHHLPPRLRERLEAAELAERTPGSRATGWLIALAVLAAVVIGIVLTVRFRAAETRATPPASTSPGAGSAPTSPAPPANGPATGSSEASAVPSPGTTPPSATSTSTTSASAAAPPAAPPASTPAAPTASPGAESHPTSSSTSGAGPTTPPATTPAATPSTTAAAGAQPPATSPVTAAEPAVPKRLYGVSVGTYLVEGRANSEKARLAAATALPARVIPSGDGDFSVVLGAFTTSANAERAAGDLITRGLVDEARVVSFPNPAYKP